MTVEDERHDRRNDSLIGEVFRGDDETRDDPCVALHMPCKSPMQDL